MSVGVPFGFLGLSRIVLHRQPGAPEMTCCAEARPDTRFLVAIHDDDPRNFWYFFCAVQPFIAIAKGHGGTMMAVAKDIMKVRK